MVFALNATALAWMRTPRIESVLVFEPNHFKPCVTNSHTASSKLWRNSVFFRECLTRLIWDRYTQNTNLLTLLRSMLHTNENKRYKAARADDWCLLPTSTIRRNESTCKKVHRFSVRSAWKREYEMWCVVFPSLSGWVNIKGYSIWTAFASLFMEWWVLRAHIFWRWRHGRRPLSSVRKINQPLNLFTYVLLLFNPWLGSVLQNTHAQLRYISD